MTLKLYNTLHHKKEVLPEQDNPLTIYTCGPTVYLDPQIGNWRMFIFYDTLIRTLHELGYTTNHVLNITDVGHLVSDADEGDDKLEKQARQEKKSAWEIAHYYTERFLEGRSKLNMLVPDNMPKATDTIQEQINLIQALEAKGATYQLSDGVYFDISTFPTYGDMAQLSLEGQQAGARVEENSEKRQPQDFALWKFSPKEQKRDMEWESPWGMGFPGWHIECSAMAKKFLGDTIDIHAGGIDHIPVHHTNEIAQSETANGVQYARFWVHGGFMLVNGTKMSKSLHNSYTLEDLEAKGFDLLAFRLMILQAHYRSESNFTWEGLGAAQNRLNGLYDLAELRFQAKDTMPKAQAHISDLRTQILDALSEDINTPRVLEVVSKLQSAFEAGVHTSVIKEFEEILHQLDTLLGLKLLERTHDITEDQKSILLERNLAREAKDYKKADELREQLDSAGIILNDFESYTLWNFKR